MQHMFCLNTHFLNRVVHVQSSSIFTSDPGFKIRLLDRIVVDKSLESQVGKMSNFVLGELWIKIF
jgi:hypothetical protein